METKYFVVSLPRSGTSSLARMAKMCGLRQNHPPHSTLFNKINKNEYDFYSDTPVYVPSVIDKICELEEIESKFIYIDRDFDEIFNSWEKVGLIKDYNMMYNRFYIIEDGLGSNNSMIFDIESYNEAFGNRHLNRSNYEEIFEDHKQKVFDLIQKHNKKMLVYNFNMGWEPFCDFIGCDVPQEELPHINKNKMFDKI